MSEITPDNLVLLKSASGELVAKVVHWLDAAENFTTAQAPLLVNEIIKFETSTALFWSFLGIVLIIFGIFAYRWSYRNAEARVERIYQHTSVLKQARRAKEGAFVSTADTQDNVFTFMHYGIPIVGGVGACLGIIMLLVNGYYLAEIYFAPRLYLLKYFSHLAS